MNDLLRSKFGEPIDSILGGRAGNDRQSWGQIAGSRYNQLAGGFVRSRYNERAGMLESCVGEYL